MDRIFIKLLVLVSAITLFGCFDSDDGVSSNEEKGSLSGCSIVKDKNGIGSIICGEDTLVVATVTLPDSVMGVDGKDGEDGEDGADGKDGSDGKDGEDGKDGINGKDGKDGKDGVDGKDGKDGEDGKDGIGCTGEVLEDGSIQISCGDSIVGVIKNGTDGKDADTVVFCGTVAYDPNKSYCSNDYSVKELPLCDEEKYNPEIDYCNDADSIAALQICGWQRYNPETHYCNFEDYSLVSCEALPISLEEESTPDEDGFYTVSDVYRSLKCSDRVAFVIRHAERDGESGPEIPLNADGKEAAKALGQTLSSGESFSYYGSDYIRSNQTGWYIAIGRNEKTALDTIKYPSTFTHWLTNNSILYAVDTATYDSYKDNYVGWGAVSAWAYTEDSLLEVSVEKWKQNVFAAMDKSNRVSIMVSHDYVIVPFIVWASEKKVDMKFHENTRWANYMSGVAIIRHAEGEVSYMPIKGMETAIKLGY
ncbi:MAG: hypothetical protein HUK20_13665 [Fibrobacter sp.]|nr:hypothetical protein [Fibrobacter sp.]